MDLSISRTYITQYSYNCKVKKFSKTDVLSALLPNLDKGDIVFNKSLGYKILIIGYTNDLRLLAIAYDKYNKGILTEKDIIELGFDDEVHRKKKVVSLRNLYDSIDTNDIVKENIDLVDKYLLKCNLVNNDIPDTYSIKELEEEANKDTYMYDSLYCTPLEEIFIISFSLIMSLTVYILKH